MPDGYTPTGGDLGGYAQNKVAYTLATFQDMVLWRNQFALQYEEIARLILPSARNTFYFQSFNFPGTKKTDTQYDANGMRALAKFAAIVDSLITPKNMVYHALRPMDRKLWEIRRVKLWLEEVNRTLFEQRYVATANFAGQQHNNYVQLGAFGTQGMFIDKFDSPYGGRHTGLRYRSLPMGELFIKENHQGLVDEVIRWWRMTPKQICTQFKGDVPERIRAAAEKPTGLTMPLNMLHHMYYRYDWDEDAFMHPRGKPWASCYVCPDTEDLIAEEGYWSFPTAVGRYIQSPGEIYGRSPAMMTLPVLKSLNLMSADYLRLTHQKARPILLTADDGIVSAELQPGRAPIAGGVSPEGRLLVQPLPTGDMKDLIESRAEQKEIVDDMFLVALFKMIEETKEMTATEVIERINEKGILMAPTVGRQETEYMEGGVIDRELDVLAQQHMLPPMPPELREAGGHVKVLSTSPLARAARAQEAAGAIRSVETMGQLAQLTGDNSCLDAYDLDEFAIGIAEIQMTPQRWMASPQKRRQKRQARAQAQQQQNEIQMAPAKAAMMNAQVKAMQAQTGTNGGVPPAPPIGRGM